MRKVVIVGGGAVGSSAAYFLASHPKFSGQITVVERDPTYQFASSALSLSSIRQQYSTPVNIELSRSSLEFLRGIGDALAVDGDRPDISLRERGYLILVDEGGVAVLRQNHQLQRAHNVDVAILDRAELAARYPWMSVEGVAAGSLGLSGEGWFDGYGLLQAFRRKARSLGATYLAREAVGFETAGGRINAVKLDDGSRLECDVVVNAAGPWAGKLAALMGVDLPVRNRRRCVFVVASREKLPDCPLIFDPTGAWMRPEGEHFLCGTSPGPDEDDPDDLPLEVDESIFYDTVWPVFAGRIPAFETLKLVRSWAGYYEFNTFDHNGIVGPHPDLNNVIFANGFSGHGIQQSPGTGRGVAELIVDGAFKTVDLTPLSFTRIVEGRPLLELNVY
jgi:FAD-dependent oxidoreductase domain-containing protein 1